MFESVIERRGLRSERFGTGAWLSIGVHAGLLGLVVFISGRPPEEALKEEPVVVFRQPAIRKGVQQAAQPKPAAANPVAPKPKPRTDRIPRTPKPMPTALTEPKPDPEPTTVADATNTDPTVGPGSDEPVGHPDGDPDSTSSIGAIGVPNIPVQETTGTEVLPFGSGMSRPEMLGGAQFGYTREAQLAGVEGTVSVKCVITAEGQVRNCRIIKGLPHMDDAVLSALYSRQYRPMTFQGRPVNVSYTFNINLKLPR
ncbi:energy transducer TonB [Corallococcus praedator]|uniref:Energy transducer TonB n=1 Tax=Corallococcus praedator TaxID=2316724 RepID=A0ABX9QH07_9BACT|nr:MULTISPECIES: energy transducer TonB [Corallococcus]RKH21412.1 energy transducer TonB [Corallococcus sp. CA047B]RKH35065.1 energy transducer TonB [Corallococcus sp. CA031C]RKI07345.1 energy transducer TonB [Corallococcus praedator]